MSSKVIVGAARLALTANVRRVQLVQPVRLLSVTRVYCKENSSDARYVGGKKEFVDPNIAQTMIAGVPPIQVDQRVVGCDGGGGALGHPKVFINLDAPGPHSCGYCGLRYEMKHHH